MGLLDALFSGSQDSGGGLLDFLRNNAMNQQFGSGLQSDQAQYGQQPMGAMGQMQPQMFGANQPSPMDNASWPAGPVGAPQRNAQPSPLDNAQWPYGPNGAPSQANAQIPQQPPSVIQAQSQPQQPAQEPSLGIGDRLGAGFRGMMANAQTGPLGAIMGGVAGLAGMGQGSVVNQTVAALRAKGVPAADIAIAQSNPEAMSALIKETFAKPTVQSLGSGYIWDPKQGKAVRAFEPDDKVTFGWQKDDNGNLHYIPHGPADPEYQRLLAQKSIDPNAVHVAGRGAELYKTDDKGNITILHKNEDMQGEPMSDAAISLAADRAILGDSKATTNLGRGAQGRADLVKIQNAIADKMQNNPDAAKQIQQNIAQQAGLVSSARALGTKETHFGVAEKAMEESIPLAQAASDAVPRSEWMTVNKLMQMGEREHSNPAVKRFLIANDTAVKDYARTINPTGALRESDIEYARKTLSIADGPEAYTAGLDQLRQEAGVMHRAIQRQKLEMQGKTAPPATISRSDAEEELRRRGKIK